MFGSIPKAQRTGWMSPEQMGFSGDGDVLGGGGTQGQDQCHRKKGGYLSMTDG